MDNFANASFHPDLVSMMDTALANAVAKLPHPVSSSHVRAIAESILRSASEGERDIGALETLALLELQISSRDV
jgi:hypothetical protein